MRFEPKLALLAMMTVMGSGCASVDKKVQSYAQPRFEARNQFASTSAVGSDPDASIIAQQVSGSTSEIGVVEASEIRLASATDSTQSAIVVSATEPPGPLSEDGARGALIGMFASSDLKAIDVSAVASAASTSHPMAQPSTDVPIDLETALELAAGQNPQVAYANERIRESFAKLQSARVLWLPSLRAGMNYNKHEGRIQDVAGNIIETSRNSVYNGFGAQAVGAGSPAVPGVLMNFHLKDSLFQPRIAEQMVGANRHASRAVSNDTLLETAIAYIDLLEASQLQAIVNETLTNTEQLASLTRQFAKVGAGLQSDADRAATDLAMRKFEIQKTKEQMQIQSVRLARLLSQDPTLFLAPIEPVLAPIELVDLNSDMASLVSQGLITRPELTEHQYLVGEAIERLKREQYAPLVPSVLLGLSYGGNGGGLGSRFQNYGDRMDFDAAAFWEVRNLGFGEQSVRCEAQSRIRQARYRHVQVLDRVASEIVEAKTQVQSKQSQLELVQTAIASARDSYRRNSDRIAAGQGLPIEAQQSILALDQAQRTYASLVAEYNRAQFRLHRALGFPASGTAK